MPAQERGVELHYLPTYSPDLNPIEAMFAKLKAHLKKAAALTLTGLSLATKAALDAVTLADIQGLTLISWWTGACRARVRQDWNSGP